MEHSIYKIMIRKIAPGLFFNSWTNMLRNITMVSLLILISTMFLPVAAQEVRVNQRKIEREREKKQKQAWKEYEKAVKRHQKMQSKSTKSSMKRTKREAPKITPTGR
jgi:Na+-translocating ferredoxin:NAD+ oxidoreductase RnfG subunit